ncbi:MAG TPA: hypothetical protein VFQ82_05110 [Stellaceae bacterium]|nr:hypothetical protein [Stellaceae bacterium]
MKISAFIIGAVALTGAALALPAATDAASPVAGYLDSATGTFTPAASQAQLAAAAALSLKRTGTITVAITLNIESSIPIGQQINCSANISSNEFPGISNNASASTVLIKTGATGKCTLVIPYQWIVTSATTQMTVGFNVSLQGPGGAVTSRSANGTFPAFAVPNGPKTVPVTVAL